MAFSTSEQNFERLRIGENLILIFALSMTSLTNRIVETYKNDHQPEDGFVDVDYDTPISEIYI